jgi:hypothetical protein
MGTTNNFTDPEIHSLGSTAVRQEAVDSTGESAADRLTVGGSRTPGVPPAESEEAGIEAPPVPTASITAARSDGDAHSLLTSDSPAAPAVSGGAVATDAPGRVIPSTATFVGAGTKQLSCAPEVPAAGVQPNSCVECGKLRAAKPQCWERFEESKTELRDDGVLKVGNSTLQRFEKVSRC